MAEKKYSVILADPPWHYYVHSKKDAGRTAESHYSTMNIEDIKALPVAGIADKDCALFLWVTFPCLLEGLEVIKAWGFAYKMLTCKLDASAPCRLDAPDIDVARWGSTDCLHQHQQVI